MDTNFLNDDNAKIQNIQTFFKDTTPDSIVTLKYSSEGSWLTCIKINIKNECFGDKKYKEIYSKYPSKGTFCICDDEEDLLKFSKACIHFCSLEELNTKFKKLWNSEQHENSIHIYTPRLKIYTKVTDFIKIIQKQLIIMDQWEEYWILAKTAWLINKIEQRTFDDKTICNLSKLVLNDINKL